MYVMYLMLVLQVCQYVLYAYKQINSLRQNEGLSSPWRAKRSRPHHTRLNSGVQPIYRAVSDVGQRGVRIGDTFCDTTAPLAADVFRYRVRIRIAFRDQLV